MPVAAGVSSCVRSCFCTSNFLRFRFRMVVDTDAVFIGSPGYETPLYPVFDIVPFFLILVEYVGTDGREGRARRAQRFRYIRWVRLQNSKGG